MPSSLRKRFRFPALPGAALALALAAVAALAWSARPRTDYQTQAVTRRDIEATVTAIGTLQPRRYVDVGAQVSGQVRALRVQPGARVEKGQLLVEIDPSVQQATVDAGRAGLAGLRAQLAEQLAQHRLADQQLARQRQLAQDEATRLEDVQTAEANLAATAARADNLRAQIQQTQATLKADEARLGYTRIYAPMAGTVVTVEAREGQTLNATYQTPNMLRIANLSGMTVWTDVSEADIGRVRPGMPVSFTTLGGGDPAAYAAPTGSGHRRWTSTVRQVLPAPPAAEAAKAATNGMNPAPATKAVVYTVLFDVDNPDGTLMPQMTAQVSFIAARAANAIAVPVAAVAHGDDGATAQVLRADGKVETRSVRLGVRSRHLVEVTAGLVEGERMVTQSLQVPGGWKWLQW